ncbi:carcinoembryonic antigen-related cell adhesion molecule 20-like isoform X1 [Polyodon spathula]|uniref:carcinoembryonic antigen-related cell adhesion molecule 20-like isoform X1 n=1 Tax=Polyodon spathula TaxID=7913 RepID=UPI001B7E6176|nr:carcinoembryonic antigen-related cell adhesion molecule 20-like isoform X1 [Polyodon spathula]
MQSRKALTPHTTMENSQAALLMLGLLLFLKGSSTLVIKPVTDPVICEVGDNVMLHIEPSGALAAVSWVFSPKGITVVSLTSSTPVIDPGYVNRVTLNTTTGSLELRSVNRNDDGVYVFDGIIIVSGNRVSFEGNVTLKVYAAAVKPVTDPVISKVGGNVTLEINPPGVLSSVEWAFGPAGIPVVKWSGSNPVIAPNYVNRVTLNTNTGSLGLSSANVSDAGVYLFSGNTVVSGNREYFNGSVTLEVYEPITNVNVKPNPAQPIENQALKLTCQVFGSQIVSSSLWLKDGQPLVPSDRITLSVDSSVVSFNPVLQSDNGEYQCKAYSPVSEVTSAVYRLEVNYGPEQASITGPDKAALNSSVTFKCLAQSIPPCIYIWYVNGRQTSQGIQYQIDAVSNVDTGSYMCMAWNSVTRRTSIAEKKLTVTGKEGPVLSPGAIAGIVIATLVGVTGIALGVYFSVKLCTKNPDDPNLGPAKRCLDAVTWPNASETYENMPANQRAGKAKKQDHTYTDLQPSEQSTYSTLKK